MINIQSVLHYSQRRFGKDLFGPSIERFDAFKIEGERESNKGKRSFGKLCNNSSYGSYGLDWEKYNITSHDRSNLAIAAFISDYAKLELFRYLRYIKENGGTVFYVDTDSLDTDIKFPSEFITSRWDIKNTRVLLRNLYIWERSSTS